MKKYILLWTLIFAFAGGFSAVTETYAQDAEPQMELQAEVDAAPGGGGLITIMLSGGFIGIVLWVAIFATSIAGMALIVDSFITIKESKISPADLIDNVRESMEQGDVMKALQHCEEEPGPLANILSAGFSNVQEGFDVVQEAIGVSADM